MKDILPYYPSLTPRVKCDHCKKVFTSTIDKVEHMFSHYKLKPNQPKRKRKSELKALQKGEK